MYTVTDELFFPTHKAFGGDLHDYIEGNDGKDVIIGDFAFYDTWADSSYPKLLLTINCSLGGTDSLHGGNGDVDYQQCKLGRSFRRSCRDNISWSRVA